MSRNAAHAQTPSEKAVQYHGLAIRDESTYSRDTPRIIRTYDGDSEVFALTLSLNLVEKIRRALCFGRWHRRLVIASEAAIDKLDSERVDRRALIESLKFHIGLKKRDIEHEGPHTAEQLEELEALTRRLHRNYADRKTVQKEAARFRRVVKTSLKDWKQSWLPVDKILDLVWMEAGLLVPYEEDADSVTSHNPNGTSPSGTHGSHATSHAQQELAKDARRSNRASNAPEARQRQKFIATVRGKDTAAAEARQRFEDYIRNFEEEFEAYEAQHPGDTRESAVIREEFRRTIWTDRVTALGQQMVEETKKCHSTQTQATENVSGLDHMLPPSQGRLFDEQQAQLQKENPKGREQVIRWRDLLEDGADEQMMNLPSYPQREDELEFIRQEEQPLEPKDSGSDDQNKAIARVFDAILERARKEKEQRMTNQAQVPMIQGGSTGMHGAEGVRSGDRGASMISITSSKETSPRVITTSLGGKTNHGPTRQDTLENAQRTDGMITGQDAVPLAPQTRAIDRNASLTSSKKRKLESSDYSVNKAQKKDGDRKQFSQLTNQEISHDRRVTSKQRPKPSIKDIFLGRAGQSKVRHRP